MKKEESFANELTNSIQRAWRHRKGVHIFGRQLVQDNTIPGIIQDCIDNLKLITPDKRKPVIIKRTINKLGEDETLVLNLPPGIAFHQIKKRQPFFSDALKGYAGIEWNGGATVITVQIGKIPSPSPEYSWDPTLCPGYEIPIPIGYDRSGLVTFDLCESPHLFIAGNTGWGKTNAMHVIVNSLIGRAHIAVCDSKRVDFRYLNKFILLARDFDEIHNLLTMIEKESIKRLKMIEGTDDLTIVKIQELKDPPPYIVVVIDEIAQLPKETMHLVWKLGSLGRAAGIHLIAGTQYPYADVVPSTLRNLFEARLCFRVASEASSRVILGEDGSMAAWLPTIKGRAVWKFGHEFNEIQTMFLTKKARGEITKGYEQRRWDIEFSPTRLLPR